MKLLFTHEGNSVRAGWSHLADYNSDIKLSARFSSYNGIVLDVGIPVFVEGILL